MTRAKPFAIPKREVWEAFKRVKANQGAAGVDGQSIEEFESRLSANLYKLWNRLSSGSYMPQPVRRVDIPKANGGTRPLGIPTVADRIAQEVVRRRLEPSLEPIFHADSYGYRPKRSAVDAIRVARQRCWRSDWVLDIDIKGFFDSIDHELLLRAVCKHTDCAWVRLYIERWLKAPAMLDNGKLVARERGTPQGGVISPLLANLFLHYAFDIWIEREMPGILFERYADDIICHCQTEREALRLWRAVDERFAACGLVLHPQKTKLVYCKDTNRKGEYGCISFDFLGYTFRPRLAKWRGGLYGVSFLPAASPTALKDIRRTLRNWGLQRRSDKVLHDLARMFNPCIRGWIGYYSHFYKSALYSTMRRIDAHVLRWAARKFKRFRQRPRDARAWLARLVRAQPELFAHWPLLYGRGRTLGAV
ncbi:group II intron reverse transcriptase/maturase [Bradyrhizobium septentrionale]|uniref:RNA-directed DNA polymerase n=1 Tax=Bradyrhizobium septentrionale TaxID=1404411 RepID=A0A974A031_9BRAD|nr:group II intron reverse transcriptase/maturase [Bradyrhizobium septentrionale]UGY11825.1 group II intron reverse transcriptase/maturase [Bradyrhizobium septentrionale]UGY11972.1 group II intron reverse transcriptase/maturase [Bradyrhizobium septentrionale]UGY12317.1 group II intron reverse transcriptase/maturase [Bradyrhizobium septentrionale]UGY25571.1 group II intron reverse transcriptase/maturase [Bradyrhizobium septentrionale]UGY25603.1 group II intron reverse transcriptase/maturase [Br